MHLSLLSLLGFAVWTLLLVLTVLLYRTVLVLRGRKRANAWPRGTTPEDEPALMVRLRDAHLNSAENLPLFAAIVAVAVGAEALAEIDGAAPYVLLARIAQSVTHALGTSHWHVFVRANFFGAQLLLYVYMAWTLAS